MPFFFDNLFLVGSIYMQKCYDCNKSYNEYVYRHCPYCSGEIEENEAKLKNLKVGDEICFGTNYGHDFFECGERMRWKVLKIQDSKALVITTQSVCDTSYHEYKGNVTWSNCTLRIWLNSHFLNWYFTKDERSKILPCKINNENNPEYEIPGGAPTTDKIFLLSIDEANTLFSNDQERASDNYWWWLRSPGKCRIYAACVDNDGCVDAEGENVFAYYGIRPALWLNLNSCCDKSYGESEYSHYSYCFGDIVKEFETKYENPSPYFSEEMEKENEAKLKNPKVGYEIYFGTNNRQKMSWKVLKTDDSKALLITTDNVCDMPFYGPDSDRSWGIRWANCTLRRWLNNDFIDGYFTPSEQSRILPCKLNNETDLDEYDLPSEAPTTDRVFLLSIDEAYTLFANDQERANGDWWILRTLGCYPHYNVCVYGDGKISVSGDYFESYDGVRPALWLNLNSCCEKTGEIEKENEAKLKNPKVGDEIYFGTNYGQRMWWKVLKTEDGKALVITTDNVREAMPYHEYCVDITWSDCTLRKWLNNEFINGCFTEAERARIVSCTLNNDDNTAFIANIPGGASTTDKIFLLSINEAKTLFADDQSRANGTSWWLRSPGIFEDKAAEVEEEGKVHDGGSYVSFYNGVRPALWLNLDS